MTSGLSVTRVLDAYTEPFLWEWKLKVGKAKAKRISEEALAIGKEVDRLIQMDIRGESELMEAKPETVQMAYAGWTLFKEAHPDYVRDIQSIQTELTDGKLVGHPDIIHLREISDVKTSGYLTIRPKWVIQASKYAIMKGMRRAAILLLSKTSPKFLYVWWEGKLVEYFGKEVFGAFETILAYEEVVSEMIRKFMESEALDVL